MFQKSKYFYTPESYYKLGKKDDGVYLEKRPYKSFYELSNWLLV